jgi:hypothetical protein
MIELITIKCGNMKKMNVAKGLALSLVTLTGFTAAAQTDSMRATWPKQDYTIIDPVTNVPIEIYYDTVNYVTINRQTKSPVDFYILNGVDTVHGATGLVVNGLLLRGEQGTFHLDSAKVKIDGDEIKVKYADGRKVKWEKGKMKIKEWGTKAKSKEDKIKMKDEWGRVRWKEGEWRVDKDS